jgi:hypothetical protein
MRDRTFIGKSGKKHAGTDVVGAIWERAVANSLGPNREANLQTQHNELMHALSSRKNGDDILAGYEALAS